MGAAHTARPYGSGATPVHARGPYGPPVGLAAAAVLAGLAAGAATFVVGPSALLLVLGAPLIVAAFVSAPAAFVILATAIAVVGSEVKFEGLRLIDVLAAVGVAGLLAHHSAPPRRAPLEHWLV